ncbi:hypothetical protein [Aureispira sp. CCB-E]|uniref:hypothetical protein n=1 Tax=Aureispira sp. CCB-E TaxID=3051121 RepID=UPI002869273F|nr:hypothetical protein [Aureispira sp. CCB-E]WMX12423.1 hypothetical protein QP953_16460 [Aureispira sp. CCB-E]
MTDRERIEHVRIFLGLNKTAFSKILGYTTPQSYTSYLSGKSGVSINMIKSLINHNPKISIDWVLKGQGQMLLNSDISSQEKIINGDGNNTQVGHFTNSDTNINTGSNNKEIEYLKKEIELLKQSLKDKERLISVLEKNQK